MAFARRGCQRNEGGGRPPAESTAHILQAAGMTTHFPGDPQCGGEAYFALAREWPLRRELRSFPR
jgi:hypothetical protein